MNNETPIANAAIAKHRLSGEPFDLHGDFSEEMRSMERECILRELSQAQMKAANDEMRDAKGETKL